MKTQDAAIQIKRNPFMRLRFSTPPQIDLLLENTTFEVLDHDVIRAVVYAQTSSTVEALVEKMKADRDPSKPWTELIMELLRSKVLVEGNYRNPLQTAAEHWQKRGWLDALVLHLRSRNIGYGDFGSHAFLKPCSFKPDRSRTASELDQPDDNVDLSRGDVQLPEKSGDDIFEGSLYDVMSARRSGKAWTLRKVGLNVLTGILRLSNREALGNRQEIANDKSDDGRAIFDRSSFAALETYVVVNRIEGVAPGVYRYCVSKNSLVVVATGDFSERLVSMCIGQAKVRNCAAALIIGAHWHRYYSRYRHPRAYRNLLINSAELAHYYILSATAAKLSNFITPAFNDDIAESILGERSTRVGPLYMVSIG